MNTSTCDALLDDVAWTDARNLISLIILAAIVFMVIVGNALVITAVFSSSKLRSVTNLFIVSLAVADLLVGVAVLPFSATWEIYKVWIFGQVWCKIWLALDVWMCTASILNLCAISLDRYVAVTRPITYPSIMSHSRAKLLIAALWVLSFVICFPPLLNLKNASVHIPSSSSSSSSSAGNSSEPAEEPVACEWQCELTNETGYVVYSALGSFYIPMFVMMFFYFRIYRAAVQTTRAINQGFRTMKGAGGGVGNRDEEQRLTLRIHRGRGSTTQQRPAFGSPHSNGSNNTTTTTTTTATATPTTGSTSPSPRKHERVKISVSYPSSEQIAPSAQQPLLTTTTTSPTSPTYSMHYAANGKSGGGGGGDGGETHLRVTPRPSGTSSVRRSSTRRSSGTRSLSPSSALSADALSDDAQPSSGPQDPKLLSKRMGKRNIKAQVKRFRMETKAAKTLAIIVGGFILCWLPFFSVYLLSAFCEDCTPPLVFSILFWLGYCNSAINPLVYALFSKDFRFAFKRIICRCFCSRPRRPTSRRGSDGSQLQTAGRQARSASTHAHGNNSFGEDSDPGGEASDSR